MSIAHLAPELFDQVHLLLDRDKADLESFFESVFIDHRLYELKDFLWDALNTCLTSDDVPFEDAGIRKDAVNYMNVVIQCLEAGKLIADRSKEKAKNSVAQDPAEKYRNIESLSREELIDAQSYYAKQSAYYSSLSREALDYYCRTIDLIIFHHNGIFDQNSALIASLDKKLS